jgi:TIR domain-containing protein
MAQIFISYSKDDRALVEELAAFLLESGYSVWWDTQLIAGKDFRKEIHRQINAAVAAIVVWSRHSCKSSFVVDEADVARHQGKLISTLVADLSPDNVPLGFRAAHHISVGDGDGLLLAISQLGIPAGKPASPYVHRLFKQRMAELMRPRQRRALPLILVLFAAGMLIAGWTLFGGRFLDSPVDQRQRLQISTGYGSDGSKSYISFGFSHSPAPGRRSSEHQALRVSNIDVFQFDRTYRLTSKSSSRRTFILPSQGYEYKLEIDPALRTTIDSKGIIAICADVLLDDGKSSEKVGKILRVEEALRHGDTYYTINFDAPDDALVEAITKATGCRYVL